MVGRLARAQPARRDPGPDPRGRDDAVTYTTVYLIERSLSLDNLFVFLLLFAYFGVPYEYRPRLLFFGIVAALALRGVFILARHRADRRSSTSWSTCSASALLVLAYRIFRGVEENVDPDRNLMVRLVRKVWPGHERVPRRPLVRAQGGRQRRYATPIFLCLAAIVFADIAFAIDSIPAAFAITRDPLLIWMGNVFALLGLRALFVLVESLIARFRYLDETIAIVLGLVGREAADRGPREGRPGGEPRGDRRGVHDRDPAVGAGRPARPGGRGAPRGAASRRCTRGAAAP